MRTRRLALITLVAFAGHVSAAHGAHRAAARPQAPVSPPLSAGDAGASGAPGEEDAAGTPQAEADPLVSNGLGSPTCTSGLARELSTAARLDCQTSGFVAAPAPTGDYGIDVHIDTGVFGVGSGAGLSVVQDLVITPLWMALVWAVHALVVMLEWCFTIDLLDSPAAAGLGGGLRRMQATVTEPWLPIALAAASVLAAYHGLVRRRVAQTVGEALVMGAMMVGGIWVIVNPAGTVGAVGGWANSASLGTLAAAASGSPSSPGRALAGSLGTLFASTIELPWCYLEFGDVSWCREPSRLDPSLHRAALAVAVRELAQATCKPSSAALADCEPVDSAQARALERSAELLRDARSNGAIFLALPANGPARNSINEHGSLLRTLCGSSEATDCRGPTAAQAEFRTNDGTWPRFGGLLLIAAGLLGMLLLIGFVAMRLLAAALFSLLYLLITPAIVLAPAFGPSGRALFREWAAQLMGAVVSKLIFSFLLGVVFAVLALLSKLAALGWWTQWLLISAFWWGAYLRRHQALGVAGRGLGQEVAERRSLVRRTSDLLDSRKAMAVARWTRSKRQSNVSAATPERQRKLTQVGRAPAKAVADEQVARARAKAVGDEQVARTVALEVRAARERAQAAPQAQRELSAKRTRLERLERERGRALADGDTRRGVRLEHRAGRVRGEIEREQQALDGAQRTAGNAERVHRRTRATNTSEAHASRERFLDEQAALPGAARARRGEQSRDYPALAGLAGYARTDYEALDPRSRRVARLEIDRELARRGERGHGIPASRRPRPPLEPARESGRAERAATRERSRPGADATERSSVMHDAREVAARRKRQLGRGRP